MGVELGSERQDLGSRVKRSAQETKGEQSICPRCRCWSRWERRPVGSWVHVRGGCGGSTFGLCGAGTFGCWRAGVLD